MSFPVTHARQTATPPDECINNKGVHESSLTSWSLQVGGSLVDISAQLRRLLTTFLLCSMEGKASVYGRGGERERKQERD